MAAQTRDDTGAEIQNPLISLILLNTIPLHRNSSRIGAMSTVASSSSRKGPLLMMYLVILILLLTNINNAENERRFHQSLSLEIS